jgi:hypothetical protein
MTGAQPEAKPPLLTGDFYHRCLEADDYSHRGPARVLTAEPEVRITNVQVMEMVCRSDGSRVTLRHRDDETDGSFVWSATTEGWLYLADPIQSLCDCGVGHHYLTEAKGDVVLIELSSGEHDVLCVARLRVTV